MCVFDFKAPPPLVYNRDLNVCWVMVPVILEKSYQYRVNNSDKMSPECLSHHLTTVLILHFAPGFIIKEMFHFVI